MSFLGIYLTDSGQSGVHLHGYLWHHCLEGDRENDHIHFQRKSEIKNNILNGLRTALWCLAWHLAHNRLSINTE